MSKVQLFDGSKRYIWTTFDYWWCHRQNGIMDTLGMMQGIASAGALLQLFDARGIQFEPEKQHHHICKEVPCLHDQNVIRCQYYCRCSKATILDWHGLNQYITLTISVISCECAWIDTSPNASLSLRLNTPFFRRINFLDSSFPLCHIQFTCYLFC